jgi:vitamin B12 transporter
MCSIQWRAARGTVFLLLSVAGAAALAQASAPMLEPVVVTAARLQQPGEEALPALTVISRADIERSQATDLLELLARQPGVQFARSGGPGSQASLFVRGAASSQTLVLVDGVRINTPLTGAAVLGGLQLDAVERVEIVRGNLSSLYGSEAVGGVVQIFTRRGRSTGASLAAEAGSGDLRSGSAAASYVEPGLRVDASAAVRRSDPFSAIDPSRVVPAPPFVLGANPDVDGDRSSNGSLRVQTQVGERALLGGSAWARRNETDFDDPGEGPQATQRESSRASVGQLYAQTAWTEAWTTRLTLAQSRDRSRNRSSVPASFNNGEFDARNRQATLANEVALSTAVAASLGLEYLSQRGGSTAYDPAFAGTLTAFERRAVSAWFGTVGRQGPQSVQVNARYDDYSDVGSAWTGLVAYGYTWAPAWRASVQVSSAFRAPSFNELHFPGFGNPALQPEKARSAEAGLRYAGGAAGGRFEAGIALFRTITRNQIVFDPAAGVPNNIGEAIADGVEISATGAIDAWRFSANATLLRADDRSTGQRLPRRAPYTVNATAYYEAGWGNAGVEVGGVGYRPDFDISTFARVQLAPYTLVRVVGTYRLDRQWSVNARIENLFDRGYELVDGYNTPGRGAFVGVAWRM